MINRGRDKMGELILDNEAALLMCLMGHAVTHSQVSGSQGCWQARKNHEGKNLMPSDWSNPIPILHRETHGKIWISEENREKNHHPKLSGTLGGAPHHACYLGRSKKIGTVWYLCNFFFFADRFHTYITSTNMGKIKFQNGIYIIIYIKENIIIFYIY